MTPDKLKALAQEFLEARVLVKSYVVASKEEAHLIGSSLIDCLETLEKIGYALPPNAMSMIARKCLERCAERVK